MKKQLLIAISTILIAVLLFTTTIFADTQTEPRKLYYNDEFIYEVLPDNTIAICFYIGNSTEITLPSEIDGISVVSVQSQAFYDSDVKSICIPEGITTLESEAFFYSKNLESVTLPSTLNNIGQGVFRDCGKLKTVSFSKATPVVGNFMFYGCTELEKVTLPDSLYSLSKGIFGYCKNLRQITLPESLAEICDFAFYQSGLESVKLPASLERIHTKAFAKSEVLSEIICSEYAESMYVADDAFMGCATNFPSENVPAVTHTAVAPTEPPEPTLNSNVPKPPVENTTMGIDVFESVAPSETDYIGSDPIESAEPSSPESESHITAEGYYIGENHGFETFEASKISSAKDTVQNSRNELLALAQNVRTMGDANNDGRVSVRDATQIRRFVALLTDETSPHFNFKNADVNTDGKVTIKDATIIQKYIASIIDSFF